MYEKVPITLTGQQLRKLSEGKVVQLESKQLQPTYKHVVVLHPLMAQKVKRAMIKGSGTRLRMSPEEIHMSGQGLSDIWHWIKSTAAPAVWSGIKWAAEKTPVALKFIKDNVIDSDVYQQELKPIVHGKIDSLLESKPYANISLPIAHAVESKLGIGRKKTHKPRPKGGSFR